MHFISEAWRRNFERPIRSERRWSLVHCARGATLTALAWTGSADTATLLFIFLFEGTKDFFVQRYVQTVRNGFRGQDLRSLARFCRYYFRRLVSNLFFAGLLLCVARHRVVFTSAELIYLLTSRIGNSSHYLLGFVEAEFIALGILSRQQVSHLVGTMTSLGSFVASLDLTGRRICGIRPFWLNIATTVLLATYYGSRAIRHFLVRRGEAQLST